MEETKATRPSEAEILRDFERYRRMIVEWAGEFGLEPLNPSAPASADIDYVIQPVFHYEIHGT